MNKVRLKGCRLKVARANEHRIALDAFVTEHFKTPGNRPEVRLKAGPLAGEWIAYVSHMPDFSPLFDRVGLILGDAVHNLRSSLDHLVFQMAGANVGRINKPDVLQFPIADDDRKFEEAAARRLHGLSPEHKAIIERYQPYHPFEPRVLYSDQLGGHFHPLRMLRELSNRDKHRQPLGVTIPSGVGLESDSGFNAVLAALRLAPLQELTAMDKVISLGTEIFRATAPDLQFVSTAVVYLPPVVALTDGKPIVPVLDRLTAAVTRVIETFEQL